MKFNRFIILAIICLIPLCFTMESEEKEGYWIHPLIKAGKSYLSFAQVPYCNPEVIRALACPLCSSILDGSYKVRDIIQTTIHKRDFKAVVLQSHAHKEIVITFGAPRIHEDPAFYSAVYTGGYSRFKNIHVERIFAHVYTNGLDSRIRKTVANLLNGHRGYNVVLVGHSFGGALAALSAYDLHHSRIIGEHNAPKVYTYGSLKVGDNDLVGYLNSRMKVIRIVKNSDLAPVLGNCKYVSYAGKWDCSTSVAPLPNTGPAPVSPSEMSKTYYPSTFNMAHGGPPLNPHSFLEKSSTTKLRKHKNRDVDYFYGGSNHDVYYKHTDNPVFTWQPIGSEVIFNKTFKKWQVCSYTAMGNGLCGVMQHPWFDGTENSNYFHRKVDQC